MKIGKKFTALPLFFQVFAIACSLMFALAVYGFLIESFREARVFLYSGLTGFLIFALINLATSNRNLKETGVTQLISLLLLFILLPLFLAFPTWIILPGVSFWMHMLIWWVLLQQQVCRYLKMIFYQSLFIFGEH